MTVVAICQPFNIIAMINLLPSLSPALTCCCDINDFNQTFFTASLSLINCFIEALR